MIRLRELGPEIVHPRWNLDWPKELERLLTTRYFAIERRMLESLQFVDLNEENGNSFSIGCASILRDAGGAFSSTCDQLVRKTQFVDNEIEETNAAHYRGCLRKEVPTIPDVCVELEYSYGERYLVPFDSYRNDSSPEWWEAFTNQKHTEFEDFKQANLVNCLNAAGALWILVKLLDYSVAIGSWQTVETKFKSRLFGRVGTPFSGGIEEIRKLLFKATTKGGTAS
jgi:hypothetical protein